MVTSYHHLHCEPNCHFWSENVWGNSLRSPQWLFRSFEKEAVIWRPPDVKMVWCVRRVLCHSSEETLFLVCFHLSQSSRSSSSFKRSQSILWQIVQNRRCLQISSLPLSRDQLFCSFNRELALSFQIFFLGNFTCFGADSADAYCQKICYAGPKMKALAVATWCDQI